MVRSQRHLIARDGYASDHVTAAPVVTTISPTTAVAGGADTPVTINGSGFVYGVTVGTVGGVAVPTVFVSPNQIIATLDTSAASPGVVVVGAKNGSNSSVNTEDFTYT